MQSNLLKATILGLSILSFSGCATQADVGKVDAALEAAEGALAKALDAYALATQANSTASEAAYAAQKAQETADAALACCNNNASKMDRMFEKAMVK